jgi:hypothetical protein
MGSARATLIWFAITAAVAVPVAMAAASPLLAWREPIYVAAGFAGVISRVLLLVQPLLAGGGTCRVCPPGAGAAFTAWLGVPSSAL